MDSSYLTRCWRWSKTVCPVVEGRVGIGGTGLEVGGGGGGYTATPVGPAGWPPPYVTAGPELPAGA